jgi:hypothetical protein
MSLWRKFRSATWGLVVSICAIGVFYPHAAIDLVTLLAGGLAWIVGWFVASWIGLVRFAAAVAMIVLIMSAWCGNRAWQTALQIGIDANGTQQWHPSCHTPKIILREMTAVIGAIFFELLLPIVLILALMTLIEAVVNLLEIGDQWNSLTSNILAAARGVWDLGPSDVHDAIARSVAPFKSPVQQVFQKGIAVITGTISASVSLGLFLLRRRSTHLSAARVIYEEIGLATKDAFRSMPANIANQDDLINRPRGQLLIGTSAERQFLLLDPGTGLAAKLPSCLLRSAVEFYHADSSLNQIYGGLPSVAFAKADTGRRRTYMAYMRQEWVSNYQASAFATLFRLGFYIRLRSYSI